MPWTEKQQKRLEELAADRMSSFDIAEAMGKSQNAVKRRAVRTGIKIHRPEDQMVNIGIRPFTDKCAELMRRAGVKIYD